MIGKIADLFRAVTDLGRDLFRHFYDPKVIEHRKRVKDKRSWDKFYKDALKKRTKRWGE